MASNIAFTAVEKTTHNTNKFAFTLSPTNYGDAIIDNPSYLPWIANDAHVRMIVLFKHLSNMFKMKGHETPLNYLSRAMEYTLALANIGKSMKDNDHWYF
uniref:Uncharacterized protein n=1 Tax=Lactuca sativa TaxID=4236 RepID=A0A9R1UPE2_LACSA|nr:hypothetical protein LSAT_V11C800451450 [Lactuca sativa]